MNSSIGIGKGITTGSRSILQHNHNSSQQTQQQRQGSSNVVATAAAAAAAATGVHLDDEPNPEMVLALISRNRALEGKSFSLNK